MGWQRRNRRSRRLLLYCLFLLAFLILWFLLTILILIAQEKILETTDEPSSVDTDSYAGRGVQVIVGHYLGNLPREEPANLTREDFDSNNYNPIEGYGDAGLPVHVTDSRNETESDRTFRINQFNLWTSDRIALNRSLPDVRRQLCRSKSYPPPHELPSTSVIIVYHNEAFSTLARTITSAVNRSPPEVLKEIILVDDFSNRTFLLNDLDAFVLTLHVRVKIIRARRRVGLIRARLMGAAEAEGEVLTFLDSHCECTKGWLEPLLARIKEDRRVVVCPIIDVINDRTFAYQKGIELFRGGFNWSLQFRWYAIPSEQRASDTSAPIKSPTMAGGLFSVDKSYFEELGTYDAGMEIWGGENIELSFRVWMCGGRVEILPCSHVGHVFRRSSPHDFPAGTSSGRVLNGNLMRVSEVWMDEWRHLFYRISPRKIVPEAAAMKKLVDVSDRVELKKRLRCKDFSWYLSNVWSDHFLPTPTSIFGRLVHTESRNCIASRRADVGKQHQPALTECTLGFDLWQVWLYTSEGQIKGDEHLCLSASKIVHTNSQWMLQLKECGGHEIEYWDYDRQYRRLIHRQSQLCLDEPLETQTKEGGSHAKAASVRRCTRPGKSQQWEFAIVKWLPDGMR